ncbi:MAG: metallophosphoesterase [Clostridia bacterium]|nr:metallophosphoesterase [Clostridia bacterium]
MEGTMKLFPTVYAVGNEYQIFAPVEKDCVMWISCGDRCFYDDNNGILRSHVKVHRMVVPMAVLDEAGGYTVHYRNIIERKAYFSQMEDEQTLYIPFRPIPKEGPIHIYHVADVHNRNQPAIAAGRYFGKDLDLLLFNGDIPDSSSSFEHFSTIFMLGSELTGGQVPAVFARGNHDLRGLVAENMTDYVPSCNGNTFYTFRTGRIWGIVLDCGEDKNDWNEEYGGTICCHDFRLRETEFLKDVIARADKEYDAPGIEYKLVVCHLPFPWRDGAPFNIEEEIYTEWCQLLKEYVKPDLMINGHVHRQYVVYPGQDRDHRGTPCPYVVGTMPYRSEGEDPKDLYAGNAITLDGRVAHVVFNNQDQEILGREDVRL